MEMSNLDYKIRLLLQAGAELGALYAMIKSGHAKPYISKAEAYRIYGRRNVEHWLNRSLLTPRKDGNHSAAWRINRMEIATLAKTFELLRYL